MRDYKKTISDLRNFNANYEANKLTNDAADAIEELLAAVPKWVSVEEQLPERYNPVLVTYIGFNSNSLLSDMVAYRDGDGDWCWWDGDFPSGEICKVKITHWMPLPEAPKEDAE